MNSPAIMRVLPMAFVLALCLSLLGCGSGKINKENYDKLEIGMTSSQVEQILGPGKNDKSAPGAQKAGGEVMVWERGKVTIRIGLVDGKLASKFISEKN